MGKLTTAVVCQLRSSAASPEGSRLSWIYIFRTIETVGIAVGGNYSRGLDKEQELQELKVRLNQLRAEMFYGSTYCS